LRSEPLCSVPYAEKAKAEAPTHGSKSSTKVELWHCSKSVEDVVAELMKAARAVEEAEVAEAAEAGVVELYAVAAVAAAEVADVVEATWKQKQGGSGWVCKGRAGGADAAATRDVMRDVGVSPWGICSPWSLPLRQRQN
jgi:hypothetical protein